MQVICSNAPPKKNNQHVNSVSQALSSSHPDSSRSADHLGIFASVLCAIHCAVTPLLLLIVPAFGKIWSHPASHWGVALFVVPLATIMMTKGYRRHRRNWIVAVGIFGICLVIAGAFLPYLETPADPDASNEEVFVYVAGEEMPDTPCEDLCCPSLISKADGSTGLHIPPASIVTTLGGIALIITHIGNLCTCAACRKSSGCPSGDI